MKQVIIVRKDLNMSSGELCEQTARASMAFLSHMIQENAVKQRVHYYPAVHVSDGKPVCAMYKRDDLTKWAQEAFARGEEGFYAKPADPNNPCGELELCEPEYEYRVCMSLNRDMYEKWLGGVYAKVVCEARNRAHMDSAIALAESLGLKEGKDYFLIEDDETLTCIGFRPLPANIANQISHQFQLLQ